ncbi:MAG: DNRLRE domain-containing protein [Thermoanaerobaculia bacterium]
MSFRTGACGNGPQTVQLVPDPGFEQGNNAWWVASPAFYIDHAPTFPNPRNGSYYAFLSTSNGSAGNNLQGGVISPQVTIPSNASGAELRFWYSVSTQETSTSIFDTLKAYLVKPGNQATLFATISNLDNSGTTYREKVVGIPSSFFGGPVQIFFSGATDGSLPTVFRVDDVTLSAFIPATAGSPVVSTGSVDQITSSSGRLSMTVNPNGADTQVWFDIETNNPPNSETEHVAIGTGQQAEGVSISVFGLRCDTTYYYRADAVNSYGSQLGSVSSFRTSTCPVQAPSVSTTVADSITSTSARLVGSVNPNGFSTTVWFAWGTDTTLGNSTPSQNVGSGNSSVSFAATLNNLQCGTTYYYRAKGQNSGGQTSGALYNVTTSPCSQIPVITITASDPTATENPMTTGEFLIQRTGDLSSALSVAYTVGGTAIVGVDHTLGGGSVTIPSGSASTTLTVFPIDDSLVEPDETVVVTLQPQSQYTVGTPSGATVTITSDDTGCALSVIRPQGGEVWTKGSPHTVQWSANSDCVDFAFILYRNGNFDGYLTGSLSGSQFSWTPPAWLVPSPGLQIDVVGFNADGTGVSARSNNFTLINPAVLPAVIFQDTVETNDEFNYYSEGWGVTNFTSHSPTHSRADSPAFYGNNTNSSLITPKIDVSSRTSLSLSFWHRFSLADFDFVNVWVKTDQGDWIFLQGFTGIQSDWRQVTINLNAFLGQPSVQVAFQIVSDDALTADGWYIDDIVLSGASDTNKIFSNGFESGDLSAWLVAPPSDGSIVSVLEQGVPGQPGKDIWTTSNYSFAPGGNTPGGGLDNEELVVGGWGDNYYSLLEFNLAGLPSHASSAVLKLFCYRTRATETIGMYVERITQIWDWRTQGTGRDRERLWWADQPQSLNWIGLPVTKPTVGQWYSIDITDLYNAWQNGSVPNYGIKLTPVDNGNEWSEFYSANYSDPAFRPRLVIRPDQSTVKRSPLSRKPR